MFKDINNDELNPLGYLDLKVDYDLIVREKEIAADEFELLILVDYVLSFNTPLDTDTNSR